MESQDIKIFNKKLSAGQYKVTVSKDYEDSLRNERRAL